MKLIPLLLLGSAAAVATAQATYTYTGNNFNSVAYWPVSYPSTGTHVTATVTLPMALPKGTTTCIASLAPACSNPVMDLNGYSWEISDGVNTIANTFPKGISGAVLNTLTFTTDANGNIINWDIDASTSTYSVLGTNPFQILEIPRSASLRPDLKTRATFPPWAPTLTAFRPTRAHGKRATRPGRW